MSLLGVFLAGGQLKEIVRTAGEEMRASLREGNRVIQGRIDQAAGATGRLIVQFLDGAEELVRLAIHEASGEVHILTNRLADRAQVVLEKAGVEARLCISQGVQGVRAILRDELPGAAWQLGFETVKGATDGVRVAVGYYPDMSLRANVVRELSRAGSTPETVCALITSQTVDEHTGHRLMLEAAEHALSTYGTAATLSGTLSIQERFWAQLYVYVFVKKKLHDLVPVVPPARGWFGRPIADEWQPLRQTLLVLDEVRYPDMRGRAIHCLDSLPSPDAVEDLAYIVADLMPAEMAALMPPPNPTVSPEMRRDLVNAIQRPDIEEANRQVAAIAAIEEAALSATVSDPNNAITPRQCITFSEACGRDHAEVRSKVLLAFGERMAEHHGDFSNDDVVNFAMQWVQARLHPLPNCDLQRRVQRHCSQLWTSLRFEDLAKVLACLNLDREKILRALEIHKSEFVFKLVVAVLDLGERGRRLLDFFDPVVVDMVEGQNLFCLTSQAGFTWYMHAEEGHNWHAHSRPLTSQDVPLLAQWIIETRDSLFFTFQMTGFSE